MKANEALHVKGLYTFNPVEFSDGDFIPSEVGNRPQGNWNENQTDETDKEL